MESLQRLGPRASFCAGFFLLCVVVFTQPWGQVAADTKLDLVVNPRGFLAGALHAYTDTFTLGQLQNQAYGYLFPQGAFFALTDALPDWIAQRLWWLVVLTVGFAGARRVVLRALAGDSAAVQWAATLAALAYALSPRTLTTLTAISSETWPGMLAPWVLLPFLRPAGRWTARDIAATVLPVALMGAVNATATLAACVPAGIAALYLRHYRALGAWLAGCAAVSLWWIGPLVVLGRYSPPFTDFIESAYVTTRWLNLPEMLRGATSWAPFVDDERTAGHLLAIEPTFVLFTTAVAALGLVGLRRAPRVFSVLLACGILVLGLHAPAYLEFLDGAGAALRNVHKFDALVRLPLCAGLAVCLHALLVTARVPAGVPAGSLARDRARVLVVAVVAVVGASLAPAFSGRLLPRGTWEEYSADWVAAADYLNEHAAGTRTLIYPQRSFAREDWGWTRDEPAQPLLEVPWAVRDAIPLVPAEAIRGLDGVMAALPQRPEALTRLGIGAVLSREEIPLPGEHRRFGDLHVYVLDAQRQVLLGPSAPVRVAGGGESLAFLPPRPYELVDRDAHIVTDTPLAVERNYGTLRGAVSAPQAPADPAHVRNRVRDYPSSGTPVRVQERGGHVAASSSAADTTAFGGADPARSVTAAVDGESATAWWPAPGDPGWLELRADFPARARLTVETTEATTVRIESAGATAELTLPADTPRSIQVPGGPSDAIRIVLTQRVGIREARVEQRPIERVVVVPDSSPQVEQFFFQRLSVDTGMILREFTAPRPMDVVVDANRWVRLDGRDIYPGQRVHLEAGVHELRTRARWVDMRTDAAPAAAYESSTGHVEPGPERLLVTGRAYNPGLRGFLGDTELSARQVDAATQAFVVPAGVGGQFRMEFAGQRPYQLSLIGGGALALVTVLACAWALRRRGTARPLADATGITPWIILAVAAASPAAGAGALAGWACARWTTLRPAWLTAGLLLAAGAMLARAPWTSATYAGDSWLLAALCGAALGAAVRPALGSATTAAEAASASGRAWKGRSTHS